MTEPDFYTTRTTLTLSAHERATDVYNPASKSTRELAETLDWYAGNILRRLDTGAGDPYAGYRVARIGAELERRGY